MKLGARRKPRWPKRCRRTPAEWPRRRDWASPDMATALAGTEIERLIQLLARLPGLGPRSARRAALFLIKKREQIMTPLAAAMQTALEKIEVCRVCGNIDTQNPCTVCTD